MTLRKDQYQAFEDILGPENICSDPSIMPAYYGNDFSAITLPKDTAQVQAIVKLCNRFKLKFRPICTGWTGHGANAITGCWSATPTTWW